eukprot:m.321759 g.321759  ORF g.321759 m.321759 type:complete len:495 (-) comp27594_c3_seq5:93-1577(-)
MNDGGALRVAAARSSGMAMQPSPLATSLTRVALDAGHPAASSPLLVSKGNVGDAVTTLNSNPNPTQSMTRADPTIPQFKKKKKKKKLLKTTEFGDKYEWTGEILGTGAYSTVREAKHKGTGEIYAVKQINKMAAHDLADDVRAQVFDEYDLLQRCRVDGKPHPNILDMVDFFEDELDYLMVFEKMAGGELLQHIYARKTFTEREAADVTRDIASALAHLHQRGIAHRDLKPQNILCSSDKHASPAKLCDFNLGHAAKDGSQSPVITRDPVGTPDYMSPEVIRQQQGEDITYNKSCDVWGLGVIVYIMLSGEAPFDAGECGGKYCGWREGDNCSRCLENLQDEITDGHLTFDGPQWKNISGAAKDLLGRMLVPEEGRISAANILRHPWVRQIAPSTPLATPDVLRRPSAVDFFNSFATGANITNRALLDGAEDGELLHRGVSMLPAGVSKSSMMERRQRRAQASQALSSFSTVLELDLEHVTTPHFRPLAATKSG